MADALPPAAQLVQMSLGYQTAQALYVAAQLGLADALADGAQDAATLAHATGTHAPSLQRLLRVLASMGLWTEDAQGCFHLTPLGTCLRADVPESARSRVLLFGQPWLWSPFMALGHTVQTGTAAFRHVHGQAFFDFLQTHPEANQLFNDGLRERTAPQAARLATTYAWSGVQTLVDVGGGSGALLAAILQAHPTVRGVLYDRPHVLASAQPVLAAAGVAARCTLVGGDFFTRVPTGGDAYLLSRILHDWGDAPAQTLLHQCRQVMPPAGKLLIVEAVLTPGRTPDPAALTDLYILVLTEDGRERTEDEFRALLARTGFALARHLPIDPALSLLEAVPV